MEAVLEQTKKTISKYIQQFKNDGRKIYATSSFQTQSVPLLHIIGNYFPEITILFLDTNFLFPETYAFKQKLEEEFNLNIITLKSEIPLSQQKDKETGLFQYAVNPDYCCYINKVKPLNDFLQSNDGWISGVRRDQTAVRKQLDIIEERDNGIIKFHPMLDWTNRLIYQYIRENNLPKHPLEDAGYVSIGCVPCTHKWTDADDKRGGRWVGSNKTECGLHTNTK